MTLEIIIFVIAVMFGILLYWRESKSNYLYRLANKITHTKELQMKKTDKKGFLFEQPFLMRLVYVVLSFLILFLVLNFLTPINIFSPKYYATTIVGTLVGTYFASLIVMANDKIEDSNHLIEETLEKGKDMIKEITEDVKETAKNVKENIEDKFENKEVPIKETPKPEVKKETPKKSGRDRLKEKGLL